jgi:flavin reductase (DIM6/NTAB) family NADH-FMN oxidoreductase RutF
MSAAGVVNLAPYSFFNMFSENPWIVGFSSATLKDSVSNVSETGEFVYNLATLPLLEEVNRSSAPVPPDMNEFEYAGIESAPCKLVRTPRVAASLLRVRMQVDRDDKSEGALRTGVAVVSGARRGGWCSYRRSDD